MEKEYQLEIVLALVDHNKASDSLEYSFLLKLLKNQGISNKLIRIIKELYTNLTVNIKSDIEGPKFNINKGVRQGDPLSPLLFNCALDKIFKHLDWKDKGIKINGKNLTNLRFMDDVVLFGKSLNQIKIMLKEVEMISKEALDSLSIIVKQKS